MTGFFCTHFYGSDSTEASQIYSKQPIDVFSNCYRKNWIGCSSKIRIVICKQSCKTMSDNMKLVFHISNGGSEIEHWTSSKTSVESLLKYFYQSLLTRYSSMASCNVRIPLHGITNFSLHVLCSVRII